MSIRGRREHSRYTSYFPKQKVHMIGSRNKCITMTCDNCRGNGYTGRMHPCLDCDGSGEKEFNVSLFEYIGKVEIAGSTAITRNGKTYSVRYFDLGHVPEYQRDEESDKMWEAVDDGKINMSDVKWCPSVPEDCLYASRFVAVEVGIDMNMDILSRFTTQQAEAIIMIFDSTLSHEPPRSTNRSGGDETSAIIPYELMGEHPQLNYDPMTGESLREHITTESEFKKLHADVEIESALT